jgi:hypothetical protein
LRTLSKHVSIKKGNPTEEKGGEMSMKKLLILVVALLLVSPAVAHANLLVNPGFESTGEQGHTTGWYVDYGSNIFGAEDNPLSGSWNARNYNDGGMAQDVAVTAGEAYQLTGWAYIPTGTGGSPWGTYIGVKFKRANGSTTASWEKADFASEPRDQYNMADSGLLVAPEDAVTATVRFGTWASDPYLPVAPTDFDDFAFEAIPEPSSLMLLLTGITGIFGLGLKKRK